MAGKSRSLNFILLVCALIGAALFYGCGGGGGGNSSDPFPVPVMQISGNIKSSGELANIVYEGNLLPDARAQFAAPGVTVHLESDVTKSTMTDSNGNYVLSGVPVGTHRVVARIRTLSGKTYKIISSPVTVSERIIEVVAPQLELRQATVALSGLLKKADGSAFPFARMTLWGEPFTTDANGAFTTPPMPEGTVENIVVANSGFQEVKINSNFVENAPFIEQVVVNSAATNRAPSVTLTATKYSVDRQYEVNLTGVAIDPDNNIATYTWSANGGYFTSNTASDTQRMWVAPNADTVATLTFTAVDAGGLRGSASIQVKVGRGMVVPNNKPVISNITVSPTDLSGDRNYTLSAATSDADGDTLAYSWTASESNGNIGRLVSQNSSSISWVTPDVTETTNVTITLTVNDLKENGFTSRSQVFTVAPTRVNQPPTNLAINIADLNNVATTTFYAYRDYLLKGSATDPEGEAITWQWSANKGTIYSPTATSTRWLTPSTPQSAEITLTVTDIKGSATTFKKTVNILDSGLQRPDVSIVASPSDKIVKVAQNISFEGLATTSAGANITADRFSWSETDGVISPVSVNKGSKIITRAYARPATYTIILEALDYVGVPGTFEYSFRVNATPTSSISQPANNSSYNQYAAVTFTGTASDIEDGSITNDSSFIWTFPAPTGVRTGRTISLTDLATGTHNISLCVADSLGDFSATSTVRVTINANQAPVATITVQPNGDTALINTPLTFTATASDPEDTTIPASNYFWTFPDPINATTGTSITVSNLPVGTQTIKLQVMDGRGLYSATQTVDIYINPPPVISAISINSIENASGTAVLIGSSAKLGVNVTDEESPPSIAWYEGSTRLGLGQNIEVSSFTAGFHTIEVRATDKREETIASHTGIFINEPPTVSILQPDKTISRGLGEKIYFEGSANDTFGEVGFSTYRWEDYGYKNGATTTLLVGEREFEFVGYQNSKAMFGTHTITLSVEDYHGAKAYAHRTVFVSARPTINDLSPVIGSTKVASGTRYDTDSEVRFSATVGEQDDSDTLTIRWYVDEAIPANQVATQTTTTSNGIANISLSSTDFPPSIGLASGVHHIFCEVTDMYGLSDLASTGVFINRLPEIRGEVSFAPSDALLTQYATAPGDIPVFLTTSPNLKMQLSIANYDYDYEIDQFDGAGNGSLNTWNPQRIQWEANKGGVAEIFDSNNSGSSVSGDFPIGYNEVTVRLYDTFHPQYTDMASASKKVSFYVWQSKDLYVTIPEDCQNMTGYDNTLYFINNHTASPTVVAYKFEGNDKKNAYIISTDIGYNIADSSTATLKLAYDCTLSDGSMMVLGTTTQGLQKLAVFKETKINTASPTIASISGGLTARSIACHQTDISIGYMISDNTLYPFNPAAFDSITQSYPLDGAPKTGAGSPFINFLNPTRVRHGKLATYNRNILVADTGNNRVVHYDRALADPRIIPTDSPIDMTPTPNRLLTISRTTGEITLHQIYSSKESEKLITFGGTTTTNEPGKFQNPVAIHFIDTNDLVILELDDTGKRKRLQLIRSGETDWLK